MNPATLPPGFRFHPTDDELVGYYLKRKVDGQKIELEVIPEIDLYKFDPWELPDKSFMPRRDMEWFFFCPRDRKYPNGSRTNRATRSGYWKATGKDRKIVCETSVSALRKTLVFYRGRAPGGQRTDWVMYEYRLCEDLCQGSYNFVGAFALCRVVKRSEHGQRTVEFQREQRIKRAVSSMIDFSSRKDLNILSSSEESPSQAKNLFGPSNKSTPTTSPLSGMATEIQSIAIDNNKAGFYGSHGLSNVPQINLLEGEIFSNMTTSKEFSIEMYQPCSLTPVSSYASLTEDSCIVDRLNENGCLSSFPIPIHSIDMYSNEEQMAQHGIEWEPIRFTTPPVNGLDAWNPKVPPAICRQESEGEEVNLWLQEDNMMIVM